MDRPRQTLDRRPRPSSSNRVGSTGVSIPKDPPQRPLTHPASITPVTASAAAIFKKLDRENRNPLGGAPHALTNTTPRSPLRQSNRNKLVTNNNVLDRISTPKTIKKPTTNIRAIHSSSRNKPITNNVLDRILSPKTTKEPTKNIHAIHSLKPLQPQQQRHQRWKRGGENRIHVVSDEEVPVTMMDKEHDVTYTKLQFLGEGGFARCYQVRDQHDDVYAAKVVSKASLLSAKHCNKLYSEIKTHGSMIHPHIVQFFSCFEDDSNVYIIMELCKNKTLVEMLKARRHLTEPEVRYYLVQLLEVCRYMHDRLVVHRDIKLSNIFVDQNMNLKLGDFGLSALLETSEDRKRTVCGTPNYIAPEILFGDHKHNQKADIWALGVVLFALLTGNHPFQMDHHQQIYRKIKDNSEKPTYVFPEQASISTEAKDLVSKMLVNDPDARLHISDIFLHPFIKHHELPIGIPHSALQGRPILKYPVTSSEDPASLPSTSTSQLDSQHTSADKKLIVTLISALTNALNDKDRIIASRNGSQIEPIIWTEHNAFLSRWVDFTSKYGLGYSISDGEMGVLFNDFATLSSLDDITYRYIIHGSPPVIEEYHHTDLPAHLRKKIYLRRNFKRYMDENLACLETKQEPIDKSNGVYLSKYVVTKNAVVFRLSNNVLQFNFFSKPKLMFMEYGTKIIYVDKSRQLKMYELTEAIATNDKVLLDLLVYAKDTLQTELQNDS